MSQRNRLGGQDAYSSEGNLFQVKVDMNIEHKNVTYIEHCDFALQELEIKVELQTIILLLEFGLSVKQMFKFMDLNLTKQHDLFKADIDQDESSDSSSDDDVEEYDINETINSAIRF